MSNEIDFVITWVDGNDKEWIKERNKYVPSELQVKDDVAGSKRYTDNGLLRYWFRGIERFAPWVRKIHFVTWGHIPDWLNTNHEKINIVKHTDFLPSDYLPTFSSVPLNLNLHRIPDLSEQFVYFNDDMFLVSSCNPDLFFRKGLPRDMAVQDVIPATDMLAYWYMVYNDIILLNKNYRKRLMQKSHPFKWININYGKIVFKNITLWPLSMFTGIYETHLPAAYLKSSYIKAWKKNYDKLNEVSMHKYRTASDVSENFIRYCQLVEGLFSPINKLKYGRYCSMKSKSIQEFILSGKYKYICINDEDFGEPFARTIEAFHRLLPDKSTFEII